MCWVSCNRRPAAPPSLASPPAPPRPAPSSSSTSIYGDGGSIDLVRILLYKLPLIYLASFALRFILLYVRCGAQRLRAAGGCAATRPRGMHTYLRVPLPTARPHTY